ncbi:FACT complex subunit-domain-containing protein [Suillus tomentosus]|nr:FACT complex subunit-domain-containing protein [Suillus tomentosus]
MIAFFSQGAGTQMMNPFMNGSTSIFATIAIIINFLAKHSTNSTCSTLDVRETGTDDAIVYTQNSLHYQSPMGSQKIDVLFTNIKHLFFQPCDKELMVIVHIHLRAPIMIGKKKAHDIQFFREASDRRQMLNKEFKLFAERVAEAASTSMGETLKVDIPFHELSFKGVPFHTNVRLQPTTECLMHLIDPPFLVVTLNEIEIASLERVQFSLKQFDLVLIFKDFTKAPLHINSIPSGQLDDVKNWLDSVDIPLGEGPVNLNWGPIMKTINESPYYFFQQGDIGSDSESELEADPEELQSEESSADASEYDGSDASDNSGSGSGYDDDSDDSNDWEELERKAAKCRALNSKDYQHNLRGVNNGTNFLPEFLQSVYNSICKRKIVMPEEHTGQLGFEYAWKELLTHSRQSVCTGKLMTEWEQGVSKADNKPKLVDMAPALSAFMAVKDEEEMKCIRTAANLTSTLLVHHIVLKLEMMLDKEAKITHEQFATQIEARLGLGEGEVAKGPDMKVDWASTEFCYSPIIQSRSTTTGYDLRLTAESSSDTIAHKGIFLIAVGMRYKGYCANLGRSIIVHPSKEQEAIYNLLLSMQSEMLKEIKDGVSAREVYQRALDIVKKEKPELEKNFVKNAGFGTGVEFRDSAYLLSSKNSKRPKMDMVLNLSLGFSDLLDDNGKKYTLHIVDTIRVGADRSTLLTEGTKSTKDMLFFLNPENEIEVEEDKPSKPSKKAPVKPLVNGSPIKNKTVGGKEEVLMTAAAKIKEHQQQLHEGLQSAGLAKYSEGASGGGEKEGKTWKCFQSYKGESALPQEVESLRICIDRKAQTIVLPVQGFAVPFHINTIKNVSKNDEGDYTYLRINFQTPGQLAGKKDDMTLTLLSFVRSYRSSDGHCFDTISKQITDLKKEVNKREQQKKEMADVIEQDVLLKIKGRRTHKLPEVFVHPALDGKRLPGEFFKAISKSVHEACPKMKQIKGYIEFVVWNDKREASA